MTETILNIIYRLLSLPAGEQLYAKELKYLFELLKKVDTPKQ